MNLTKLVAEWAQVGAYVELDDVLVEDAEVENLGDVNRSIIAIDPGAQWEVPGEVGLWGFREGIGAEGWVYIKELEE